jgi:HEAT repeat protein
MAAIITVPFIGAAVAAAAHLARGRGTLAMRRRRPRPRQALTIASIRSVGSALSPCDALVHGDEEQRRGALSRLSRRADADAIALLRRTAVGRDPDLALSAALVLDEIRERLERVVDHPFSAELRHVSD